LLTYLYLILTLIFFSSIEVLTVFVKGGIHPITLTVLRFLIGGVTLLPLALFKQKNSGIRLRKKDLLDFAGIGVLICGITMGAAQVSVFLGKPSTTAVLMSSTSVFVILFSLLFFKEKITISKILTLILGVAGICFISFSPGHGDTVIGVSLGVFGSMSFALYTILNKRKCEEIPSIITVAYSFLFGSLISLPVIFFLPGGTDLSLNLNGWLILFYLGIMVTGLAYFFFFKALEVLSASAGSLVFFVKPIISSLMAYILLDDRITSRKVVGIALVLIAISLPILQKKFKPEQLELADRKS
jgi:drug/metabolite transporter (DMT)-like permease